MKIKELYKLRNVIQWIYFQKYARSKPIVHVSRDAVVVLPTINFSLHQPQQPLTRLRP